MRLMVDWITAHIEPVPDLVGYRPWEDLKGRFDTGRVLKVGRNGEMEWESAARLEVRGSHDTGITVRSRDGFSLELSGNPVKFLQGHNLFGSDDALALFFETGMNIRKSVGEFPSPATWGALNLEGPRFTRIDITRSYRFPTQSQAREWLRYVAGAARSRHGSASLVKESTVYFGKGSRRWTMKVYNKYDEILARGKTHRLLSFLDRDRKKLEDWAQGVLRFEIQLRGMELAKWPTLSPESLPSIWQHYYDTITWNRNAELTEGIDMADQSRTDQAALGYLARWKTGEDLRLRLTKPTFYRWRQRILADFGVDIATPPVQAPTQVITAALDPLGWDPEPIEGNFHRPDLSLPLKYGKSN